LLCSFAVHLKKIGPRCTKQVLGTGDPGWELSSFLNVRTDRAARGKNRHGYDRTLFYRLGDLGARSFGCCDRPNVVTKLTAIDLSLSVLEHRDSPESTELSTASRVALPARRFIPNKFSPARGRFRAAPSDSGPSRRPAVDRSNAWAVTRGRVSAGYFRRCWASSLRRARQHAVRLVSF
jgi:hypothetical protein